MTRFFLVLVLGLFVQTAMAQRFVKTFDTIDQMLAANPRDIHTNAITLGRTAVSDGGGGQFYYVSSSAAATNRGTVFKPNSYNGRWFRDIDGGDVNILWFGAVTSKATDSTAAFQDALWFAAKPTHGPITGGASGYAAMGVYVPPGEYKTSASLTNYGVRFFGKSAHYSGNYNADSVIHSMHGGPFMVFDYGGVTGPLLVADYRVGSIDDVDVEGYPETYPGTKVAITAVTDRLNFTVSPGSLPTLDVVNPQMNVAFFYDDQGHWLGSGQISSVNTMTGAVTLTSGADIYATVGGSLLRTVDKVVFTPTIAQDSTITNFADPSAAGPVGILMKCSYNGVGHGPTIKNVLLSNFHVGLRVGPGLLERRVRDLKIQACKYAGILYPREYNSTDSPYEGMTYITGGYRADYGTSFTNTIVNPQLCNTTVCWYGLGPYERAQIVLVEGASWAQMIIQRGLGQHIDYLFGDLCVRHGLVVQRGYTVDSAAAVYDNTVAIDVLSMRTGLPGWAKFAPDAIHADRYGVDISNVGASNPALLALGTVSVCDGGQGDFSHGFRIVPSVGNEVRINQVAHRWGTANWYTGQAPSIVGVAHNLSSSEVGTGVAEVAANNVAIVINGTNAVSTTASGTVFTTQSQTPAITMVRADTGKSYSWLGGTDSVVFNNDSQSRAFMTTIADTSAATLSVGHSAATWAPRVTLLTGEVAGSTVGTDVSANDMYFVSNRGTGASTGGGRIIFHTADAGVSGTATQTTSTKLQLKREGQLNFTPRASEPTVNVTTGDLFYKTGTGFRYYDGSAWNTIGAGGGSGTVTSVSVATANGFSGTVANPTTTPSITISAGAITPTSVALGGTAGDGFVMYPTQSSPPSTPASGFVEYADSTGRMAWKRASDGFVRTVNSTLTADRVYTWPNANTTVPIVSQQLTLSGPTAARTITLPDANFTAARIDAAQTFSGVQTFGGGAIYIGSAAGTAPYMFSFSGNSDGSPSAGGLGLTIYNYAKGDAEYGVSFRGAIITATASDSRAVHMSRTFAPTSGNATWSQLSVQAAVNQTGGASGITRNLYVNSAITAAADHRALEVAGGKSFFTYSPASSEPAIWLNGTWFTGGTSTTTKPQLLVEHSGTTSTGWSVSGTGLGINAASGFTGNLLDAQLAGTSKFKVSSAGDATMGKVNGVSVASGTGTPALTVNGTASVAGTNTGDQQIGGATGWRFYEEFNWNSAGSGGVGWLSTQSGGANSMAASPAANRPGIFQLSTSTSTTGNPNLMDNGSALFLGGGPLTMEWSARITTGLPSTADDYDVWMGLGDTQTSSSQTDGVYFLFDRGVSAVNWQFVTAKAGTRTTTDTGIAANGSGTWQKFRFEVNAAATSVVAYIDGIACATNTVNLPDTSSNLCGKMFGLLKQGGSVGTTAEILQLDYVWISQDFTSSR